MITAWFDGACEPTNPGGVMSYGAYIIKYGKTIWSESKIVETPGQSTNNIAEYSGFIAILEYLLSNNLQDEPILIHGDSKLVIEQMFGTWQIKSGAYKPYALKSKELLKKFKSANGTWIPREENEAADELSKCALQAVGIFQRK